MPVPWNPAWLQAPSGWTAFARCISERRQPSYRDSRDCDPASGPAGLTPDPGSAASRSTPVRSAALCPIQRPSCLCLPHHSKWKGTDAAPQRSRVRLTQSNTPRSKSPKSSSSGASDGNRKTSARPLSGLAPQNRSFTCRSAYGDLLPPSPTDHGRPTIDPNCGFRRKHATRRCRYSSPSTPRTRSQTDGCPKNHHPRQCVNLQFQLH